MISLKIKLLVVLFICACCSAFGIYYFLLAKSSEFRAPTDKKIISIFTESHAAFDRLRQMAIEDSLKERYFSKSHLDARLGSARQQEYQLQFDKIQADVEMTASDQSIRFIFASNGKSAIGPEDIKGIEYLRVGVGREGILQDNLDNSASLPTGNVYLRKIEPSWFIFVQKID